MRRYIDEFMELPESTWLKPDFKGIKEIVLEYNKNGLTPDEIVRRLQEELYIFTDEEETAWELEVVKNILDGKEVINRWTNVKFV